PAAPYYGIFLLQGGGIRVEYRVTQGGAATVAPISPSTFGTAHYLQIQRRGDSFVAALSSDGDLYVLVAGSGATVVMAYRVSVGLMAASGQATGTGTATFRDVEIGGLANPPVTPTPPPDPSCPSSWQ